MLTTLITVCASLVTAILTAIVTYILTIRKEREAEWRKLKLERYQEFFLALSGVVGSRATPATKRRLSDAGNSLSLVAPIEVLRALQVFQHEISPQNKNRTMARHDALLSELFRAMRADIHPSKIKDDPSFIFQMSGPQQADKMPGKVQKQIDIPVHAPTTR